MSRSKNQVRRAGGKGAPAAQGTTNPAYPDVTTKDGSANVAGTVERMSTDQYQPAPYATDTD